MGEEGLFDLSRVYVNGASQGGGMGIACCALNADLIAKASILYPFLSDYRKVYELGADEIAYEGIRYYARWFDPDGTREDTWFGKLAYVETNHFAHLVRCPVLFGTGLADTVCPPATQCAVYNELSCEKERLLYPGKGHEEIQDFDDLLIDYLDGRVGRYEELRVAAEGAELRLMCVAPQAEGPHPLVLMFHDLGRPARGWHHITRYLAAGFAVVQMENRADASAALFGRSVADALAAYDAAVARPGVDATRVVCFGEGYGGALALAVAARRPTWKVVALNPYPTAELLDVAPEIGCPVLLGTARMDEVAPAAEQDRLAAALPQLTRKNYPKYVHERINAFENAFLAFVHD
jgi:cephalosporin-C deacetylase-like acetyl esterase